MKTPTMLMILDGFGLNPDEYGNAIKQIIEADKESDTDANSN